MSSERKDEHVDLADAQHQTGPRRNDFDDVEFVHHALAGVDPAAVDLGAEVFGTRWAAPLYINGMTGGSARTAEINRDLAIAARETGIPIASGSMSMWFKDPSTEASFRVLRDEHPDGFVMANLSADADPDRALRAVDLLEADALQVHINSVQESVMPEGTRDFSQWARNIEAIAARLPVPVVVKEVGFGMSRETLRILVDCGVRFADVSGVGGTDFARIENDRRSGRDYAYMHGWGLSAVCSLLDAEGATGEIPQLLASGGVRHPLDVIRALALGARAVGVSGVFLHVVLRGGADALITAIRAWLEQIAQLHALLGAEQPSALATTDLLLRGRVREFCDLRGITASAYATRSGGEAGDRI